MAAILKSDIEILSSKIKFEFPYRSSNIYCNYSLLLFIQKKKRKLGENEKNLQNSDQGER